MAHCRQAAKVISARIPQISKKLWSQSKTATRPIQIDEGLHLQALSRLLLYSDTAQHTASAPFNNDTNCTRVCL
ncbi:hypothetical protein U6B65_13190 [Oscillospiraceae bacterium MB08-C2-2]|nr:hypothetical protein U6B65_13190 [Oscillospiraceae bacterium MB08-C2-2]